MAKTTDPANIRIKNTIPPKIKTRSITIAAAVEIKARAVPVSTILLLLVNTLVLETKIDTTAVETKINITVLTIRTDNRHLPLRSIINHRHLRRKTRIKVTTRARRILVLVTRSVAETKALISICPRDLNVKYVCMSSV